jgi:ectoine hydroxylase-related dioxygenase (phytanoyl-CoA dioxygenase family)
MTNKEYGIVDKKVLHSVEEGHLEEFDILGYTVIEDVLTPDELNILREEIMRVYEEQEFSFSKDSMQLINEKYLARAPLCYSESYLKLAQRSDMLEYVKRVLGDYYILNLQNGIINMPGEEHHQSSWHRDLPYQNWVSNNPLACNLYYCLDDYSAETGATCLLPFSHKLTFMPSIEYVNKHAIQVKTKAGSVVLFNSMIFHKAGFNHSDQIRRGINHVYSKAIIRQQIDLPRMLGGRYKEDPLLNRLLGYDAQTAQTVEAFRQRRLEKSKRP